jgi:hypothetical protein
VVDTSIPVRAHPLHHRLELDDRVIDSTSAEREQGECMPRDSPDPEFTLRADIVPHVAHCGPASVGAPLQRVDPGGLRKARKHEGLLMCIPA